MVIPNDTLSFLFLTIFTQHLQMFASFFIKLYLKYILHT